MNLVQKIKLALALKKAQKEIAVKGFKNFLTSKTIIGLLTAAVPLISSVTGIGSETLQGAIGEAVQAAGLIFALIGRFTATKALTVGSATSDQN